VLYPIRPAVLYIN